jgi:hypothetical protein
MRCLSVAMVMLLCAPPLVSAQVPRSTRPDTAGGTLSYPLPYDSVEAYLRALIPPEGRDNVRNLELSADGFNLRVDADVKVGALPGFELLSYLGWARLSGTGPVKLLRPGLMGWEITAMQVNGQPIAAMMWSPLIRRATRRSDTILPFAVGRWVKRVEVEPTRLMLY